MASGSTAPVPPRRRPYRPNGGEYEVVGRRYPCDTMEGNERNRRRERLTLIQVFEELQGLLDGYTPL